MRVLETTAALRKLLGSRYELSLILIAGSLILIVAIVIGNSMGNKVLGQIARRASFSTTPVPIPTPSAGGDEASQVLARRHQVLSVATDPAFPDPRITPEPPPPATPQPVPATPRPTPSPTQDDGGTPDPADDYTSPPLSLPLESHAPGDEASPAEDATSPRPGESPASRKVPARGFPSLAPSSNPTP